MGDSIGSLEKTVPVAEGQPVDGSEDAALKPSWVGEKMTPIITSKLGQILIPLIFGAVAVGSGVAMLQNATGLNVEDVVPDDSYVTEFVGVTDQYWQGELLRSMAFVFKGDFYADEQKVADMYELFEWIQDREDILGKMGQNNGHWHEKYVDYLEAASLDPYTDFSANLATFLADPLYEDYRSHVTCVEEDFADCTEVKTARFFIWQSSAANTNEIWYIQDKLNSKIEASGFEGSFSWIDEYGFADADHTIMQYTIQSLSFAVIVVMLLMIILMDTVAAAIIFLCVISVDLNLLAMLYFWDVALSSISFSGLIMSIGLSIDYNVHVAHAFLHGKGKTVEARTRYAYDMIGLTVLKGGLTTLAGTVVLSNASSTVFRIFFKVCFGTVVSGILHGMVLMPCLLGIYASWDSNFFNHDDHDAKVKDEIKKEDADL
jgi:predicted RND superfamily exporter protein